MFFRMSKKRTEEENIDMTGLEFDKKIHTTLPFVEKIENGDRVFSFYRNPDADIMINKNEINKHKNLIKNSKIFIFENLSFTAQPDST